MMEWVYDDGGRKIAGYKGHTGDCVCRAIAIATGMPYKEVYDLINKFSESERKGKRRKHKSSARTGVRPETTRKIMKHLGWEWIPTMTIGSGCKVHLNADELPKGTIVVKVTKHVVAVIDGVIHDTYNSSEHGYTVDGDGNDITTGRCVYGYYRKI